MKIVVVQSIDLLAHSLYLIIGCQKALAASAVIAGELQGIKVKKSYALGGS